MNKKITPKLKAVIMATTKNGKVPAKVAREDPKAVDKLKDEGLAKTQKGANGKTETVLTKAGKEAKAKVQDPEKASKKSPAKEDVSKYKPEGRQGKSSPKPTEKTDSAKPEKSSKPDKEKPKIRKDTKQYTILKLLSRPQGATIQQLHEATDWKLTTLRGTPGALKLKLGLEIKSEKRDGEDTVYRIVGGLDGLL